MQFRYIVCLKQVPDTSKISVDPVTGHLCRSGVRSIINPPDLHAIEAAVRLREQSGGRIAAVSMGPAQAETALREALARGIDEGFLLCDQAFSGADTFATSYTLSETIKYLGGAELIICGKQAIDGDTAQVGPGIAEFLGLPCLNLVTVISRFEPHRIQVESMTDSGHQVLSSALPAVLTVVKQLNTPRLVNFVSLLKARRSRITHLDLATLGLSPEKTGTRGSHTWVKQIHPVNFTRKTRYIKGTPDTIAEKIIRLVKESGVKKRISPAAKQSQDIPFKGTQKILIVGELHQEGISEPTLELVSEANAISCGFDSRISVVFCGYGLDKIREKARSLNVETVFLIDSETLSCPEPQNYSNAVFSLLQKKKHDIILGSATCFGRSMLPRMAVRLDSGLTADCTSLAFDRTTGQFLQTRPAFGGNILATITGNAGKPQMATVRPGVFKQDEAFRKRSPAPQVIKFSLEAVPLNPVSVISSCVDGFPEHAHRKIIVSGGKGLKNRTGFKNIEKLAGLFGGSAGASRAAVDAGWADYSMQIGQTGKTIQPEAYLAFGISGAVQHLVGMQSSGLIIAVNIDPGAAIFKISDYAIVSDWVPIVESLINRLTTGGKHR